MIHLSRSTAVFAVRLLLSVAVVYRFFHAENKSIFAQRYGPCTPPDGTKHTNVRRAGTKYKTIVKDMRYPLIPCGFFTLAPLAEMRYTGNTETNVKGNSLSQNLTVLPAPSGREALAVAGSVLALSVTAYAVPPLPKGEALAWRQSCRLNCEVYGFARGSPFGRAGALAPERARTLTAAPRFRRKRRCKCSFPLRPLL